MSIIVQYVDNMHNVILFATTLLFAVALTTAAAEYPWQSQEGKHLVHDQVEGWNPETVAVGIQDLPRGVVHDRVRRQMPPMPEVPSPPQGMPAPPQPPQGLPSPPGMPS
ncbi:uncharacterized protein LOC129004192 [Macrosteles quadrilineatus]|uniref:uncharacterized protein LOC129004192 n=1 Tax=Macrosteles quadrilineatus TaxID=74068 RepID=UPI0023E1FF24|nr:uncharacterized protein LOC129004192 [Macrosteles quadrilineatus]